MSIPMHLTEQHVIKQSMNQTETMACAIKRLRFWNYKKKRITTVSRNLGERRQTPEKMSILFLLDSEEEMF
jgi:hypothetical protein